MVCEPKALCDPTVWITSSWPFQDGVPGRGGAIYVPGVVEIGRLYVYGGQGLRLLFSTVLFDNLSKKKIDLIAHHFNATIIET